MESIDKLPEDIKNKLKIVDGHWIWIGGVTDRKRKDLKGRLRFQGRMEYPHRVGHRYCQNCKNMRRALWRIQKGKK